ncbi:MAG: efflux RND transporter periplasmic adaptor subunit [Pseudomonadota bacterium]
MNYDRSGVRDSSYRASKRTMGGVFACCLTALLAITGVAASSIVAVAQDDLIARGVVQPKARNTVAVDLAARVTTIPFRNGENFQKGDILIAFDCRRQKLQHKAALANKSAEEALLKQAKTLKSHNAGGQTAVKVSAAKAESTLAEAEMIALQLEQCEVKAPFSGRIIERLVEPFDLPQPNEPLLKIVDDGILEIELLVPSKWLHWLKAGVAFEFLVEDARASYRSEVTQVAAIVDPISQTIKINAVFLEPPENVLSGMSGTARFTQAEGSDG